MADKKIEKEKKLKKDEKIEQSTKPVTVKIKDEKSKKSTDSKEAKKESKIEKVETEKIKKTGLKKAEKTEKIEKGNKEIKKSLKKDSSIIQHIATGRRKKAVARVRLISGGTGKIIINKLDIDEYFPLDTLKLISRQPLVLTKTERDFDILINVNGGGLTGQAGAVCHGIARALIKADETFKPEIKKAGFLTRDARKKERKKYGLKKARKAPPTE